MKLPDKIRLWKARNRPNQFKQELKDILAQTDESKIKEALIYCDRKFSHIYPEILFKVFWQRYNPGKITSH
jgi:hypothetical protein